MPAKVSCLLRSTFLGLSLVPAICGGAGLTVTDTCQRSVSGMLSGASDPVSVAGSDGSIVASQFAGVILEKYVAGLGQCDPLPPSQKPLCTLSASHSRIAKTESVVLFAKCPAVAAGTTYVWNTPANGPALPSGASTSPSLKLDFPSAGAFTYSVAANSPGNPNGNPSAPVTILVGTAGIDVPNCIATASPNVIVQQGASNIQVTCHPEAATYSWESVDAGAPTGFFTATPAGGPVTFPAIGSFTYKVSGSNSLGAGPKASTTVTVKADSSPCTGYGNSATWSDSLPQGNILREHSLAGLETIAYSFVAPNNEISFIVGLASYGPAASNYIVSISQTPGDFSATGACFYSGASLQFYTAPGSYGFGCVTTFGQTYYVNIKNAASRCATVPACGTGSPSSACTHRINR